MTLFDQFDETDGERPAQPNGPVAVPEPPTCRDLAEPEPAEEVTAPPTPVAPAPLRVEVIRSRKRKRTVGAQVRDGVLRVSVPSWMTRAEEANWVTRMSARFERMTSAERLDLRARSTTLARRHGLRRPTEIKWADNMATRWGSCTPSTGVIRISTRLAPFPDWVVDYVIVHELAHLSVAGHGADFWELVHRYPKSERAIGYLIAKAGGDDSGDDIDDG